MRDRTLVGRLDDCHIRVPIAGISRKHCEIVVNDGAIVVNDLGSSNGTYVNQDRVQSQPVSAGDLISFGGLVFLVTVNGEPGDIDAEMMFEDGIPESDETPVVAQQTAPAAAKPQATVSEPEPQMASISNSNDDSSMMDFEFDFDDEDDQPPL
jgi:pSer/pThr/pTyr-binding forkhead associated (FHA) protein